MAELLHVARQGGVERLAAIRALRAQAGEVAALLLREAAQPRLERGGEGDQLLLQLQLERGHVAADVARRALQLPLEGGEPAQEVDVGLRRLGRARGGPVGGDAGEQRAEGEQAGEGGERGQNHG